MRREHSSHGRPMHGSPRLGGWGKRRLAAAALVLLGLIPWGCTTGAPDRPSSFRIAVPRDDVRIETSGDTIYVLTRSDSVTRGLCAGLGGDIALAEGRWAADDGKTIRLGRVTGCHTVRHVIVCAEGDEACLSHEDWHRRGVAFHQ